jgi:plasmid segregation protein ParM
MKNIVWETANSSIKVHAGGDNTLVYHNTLTEVPQEKLKNRINKDASNDSIYTIEGKNYYVGKLKNYITNTNKDDQRYRLPSFYKSSIIALSQFVEDKDVIYSVTGLPARHYNDKTIKELKELFENKVHTVIVNGKEKSFEIKQLDVLLQPVGTYYYSMVGEDGKTTELYSHLINGKTLIIDIGFGSTDFAEIIEGELKNPKESGLAMNDVYQALIEKMKLKFSNDDIASANLKPLEVMDQLREKHIVNYSRQDYDIKDIKEDTYKDYAERIISGVTRSLAFKDYDTVIFTGGGSTELQEYLGLFINNNNTFIAPESRTANVKGFYLHNRFNNEVK